MLHDVAEAINHPGIGGQSIASRAARLLVIPFHAFRQIQMRDEPYIGLVDAHTERDGRHHHHPILADEAVLIRLASAAIEPGVIGQCIYLLSG